MNATTHFTTTILYYHRHAERVCNCELHRDYKALTVSIMSGRWLVKLTPGKFQRDTEGPKEESG